MILKESFNLAFFLNPRRGATTDDTETLDFHRLNLELRNIRLPTTTSRDGSSELKLSEIGAGAVDACQVRPNLLSSSSVAILSTTGRPCGQTYGIDVEKS